MWGNPDKAQQYFNENVEIMEKKSVKERELHEAALPHTRNPIVWTSLIHLICYKDHQPLKYKNI